MGNCLKNVVYYASVFDSVFELEVWMEFVQQAEIVEKIHETLVTCTGKRLRVRANMGRSKIVECEGVLTQAHPQLFIMEIERKRGRVTRQSYQYVDILTGTVELMRLESDEPLFPVLLESM